MFPHFRKVVICRASEGEERICRLHIMWETRRRSRRRLSHLQNVAFIHIRSALASLLALVRDFKQIYNSALLWI